MQVLSPQIAALFPADCALLGAERCQRTRSRVQQQQDWKNHLISWRFSSAWHRIGNDCHKTLNRFWRHSDLIEVKDGRYESHTKRICASERVFRSGLIAPAAWRYSRDPSRVFKQRW